MRITKIQEPPRPMQPSMGMRYQRTIRYDSDIAKRVIDNIHLDNGKHLRTTVGYEWGDKVYKLQYLIDSAGNWIRSRLRYYKGRQVIKELNSKCNE